MKSWALVLAWAAALPTGAWAEPAHVVDRVGPEYPSWARGTGIDTEVELRVLVGRDGRAKRVEVLPYDVTDDILTRKMRASFDSAAVRVVRRWRFAPAMRGGKVVPDWLTVRVLFSDHADEGWLGAGAPSYEAPVEVSHLPEAVTRPVPRWPRAAPYVCEGMLMVEAALDSTGVPVAARVRQRRFSCPDAALATAVDSAVVRAMRDWRFTPAVSEGGEAMPVLVAVPFRIPIAPPDSTVIVGCVRDSLTGRTVGGASVAEREGPLRGTTDEAGWFVLRRAGPGTHELRAWVFCRGGGYRPARIWSGVGDAAILYLSRGTCSDDTR